MATKGARILVETLIEEGTEVIFGYPGGAVLPLFDALYDAPIRFVLVRHEQAAAHAADGYARATGRVGVCIATSGPGATNLTTGIATANMDSIPVIAITGQVKTHLIGNDAFQEADTTGITRSITKHNYLVKDIRDLARTIKEAFYIARTGRPGPVVVDVPVDITMAELEGEAGQAHPPARLQAAHGRASAADPPRGRGAERGAEAGALRRRRGHPLERLGGTAPVGRDGERAGDHDADGPGRVPGRPPPVAGHARHARHAGGELRRHRIGPGLRRRRALRRPRHRPD